MSAYLFDPHPPVAVPIRGSQQQFPVRRIFCVGRNYGAHAREMGFSDREPPFFFTKPADALVLDGAEIPYPMLTENLHHEIELVLAIDSEAKNLPAEAAMDVIFGVAVGIDLTRRDLQMAARDKGRPWDWGKSFDQSAPIGEIVPLQQLAEDARQLDKGRIWLDVNGTRRQEADLAELIWNVPEIISAVSKAMHIMPGDLIYTGTPAGVGAIEPGDRVTGGIDGIGDIAVSIGARAE
jgi:fumarylpyruvate hydrolase